MQVTFIHITIAPKQFERMYDGKVDLPIAKPKRIIQNKNYNLCVVRSCGEMVKPNSKGEPP